MDTNVANHVVIFTKGSGHSQEGDLINDCTPPHRTVMGQSGTFPHNTVHPRFLHYTTLRRIRMKLLSLKQAFLTKRLHVMMFVFDIL